MHATIRQFFSTFAAKQQRAHDTRFPMSRTKPHILTVFWDHAKAQSPTHTDLLDAMNCTRPSHDMKLYQLVAKGWNKVTIALLQRARNVQTIAEALVYNHTRSSKRYSKVIRETYSHPGPNHIACPPTPAVRCPADHYTSVYHSINQSSLRT